MSNTNRKARARKLSLRAEHRETPDLRKLSRALIALALAQAQAEAEAQAEHEKQATEGPKRAA